MEVFPGKALIDLSKSEGNAQQRTPEGWYWYVDGDRGGAVPFNIRVLYRGQNKRFIPMLPSIARGLESNTGKMSEMPASDQANVILRLAQSWWFARELDHHPITQHADLQRIKFDRLALAQHYGIPTGYLDLTDSFDVAAFFATCEAADKGWKPVEDGVGIIYRLDINRIKNPFDILQPLGPQSLPRPEEQKAWVCELPMVHSFDGWPVVSAILFQQDSSIGEHFMKIFDGGKVLFPSDVLSNVAEEILNSTEIPKELVEAAFESFVEDPFGPKRHQWVEISREIKSQVTLAEYRRILTEDWLSPYMDDFEWRRKRLSDVVASCRPVCLVIRPDMDN